MLTPGASLGTRGRAHRPARLIPLRRRKRVRPSRPRAVWGCPGATRRIRQRSIAIKMLPTWLAVATMLNAPAAQIAIVMGTAMSERHDARVTAITLWLDE